MIIFKRQFLYNKKSTAKTAFFGSSDIWSDVIVKKKKTAEQIVYLNNNK